MAVSRSGGHDRRGFDTILKAHIGLAIVSLAVLGLYNWKIGLAMFMYSCIAFITTEVVSAPPENSPRNFKLWARHRGSSRKPVLLCLGDSLTHGNASANITPQIPFKLSSTLGLPPPTEGKFFFDPLWVVNAGQNYLTTYNILHERLHSALSCYPDFIYLMIGTNDVLVMQSQSSLTARFIKHINQLPQEGEEASITMETFERNYTQILNHLWQSSPLSQVGVCTLPPMGENLDAPQNRLIREANEIIQKVAASASGKVQVIDVYGRLEAILEKKKGKGSPVSWQLPIFILMAPLHYLVPGGFFTWNRLSAVFGNTVLLDGLHLNDRGRDQVVDATVDWLVGQANVAKAIAVKS